MSAQPFQRLRSSLREYLGNYEALTGSAGRLGTPEQARIYPHGAPAGATFPYIVTKRADKPGQRTINNQRGLRYATFDFETWGDDSLVVEMVAEALRDALEAFLGERGPVTIRSVTLEGEVDDAARPEDGGDEQWFVTILTVTFGYIVLNSGGV